MYTSIIIGSGFSGICMAIKLKERGIHNFIILEKADNLGGTWRENTYPGAECDIPSALYSYSFEPYPDWEYKWSHQHQILEYLKYCANKYDIDDHIKYNSELVKSEWKEDDAIWEIETTGGDKYNSITLITAVGQLHHPSVPDFTGKDEFEGASFHSAKWDHDVQLEGKRIGVIGNAASAIQFIPQIGKIASDVTIFQRSANWMLPKQDRLYKEWEKKLVRKFPFLLKIYRFRIWMLGGGLFFLMKSGNNILRNYYQNQTVKYIKKYIDDGALVKALIPDYPMGAKRILFSDDYYESLGQGSIHLETNSIERITERGILTTNGTEHHFDVIIYATGFKSNPFLLGLDIKGRGGLAIADKWYENNENYLGITVSEFPNFFMMYGPNTNLGHNSIIIMSEAQAKYITQAIKGIVDHNWKSIEVKKEAAQSYYKSIQLRLDEMVWGKIEKSWYKSAKGDIPNNYPGRTMEYMRRTRTVNFSDYIIQN